jgi:hypothetical protein
MGSNKNKKATKQSKVGKPPKKSGTSKQPCVEQQASKARPKLRPRTRAAVSDLSNVKADDLPVVDVNMLSADILIATEGLLGLANRKGGLEEHDDLPDKSLESEEEDNGGVLNPEDSGNESQSSSKEEDPEDNEG